MRKWTKAAGADILEKFPDLDGRPETVRFAVWCLDQDPGIEGSAIRDLGKDYGLKIAGRALGAARQIVGLEPACGPAAADTPAPTVSVKPTRKRKPKAVAEPKDTAPLDPETPNEDAAIACMRALILERQAVSAELAQVRAERAAALAEIEQIRGAIAAIGGPKP